MNSQSLGKIEGAQIINLGTDLLITTFITSDASCKNAKAKNGLLHMRLIHDIYGITITLTVTNLNILMVKNQ